MPAMHNQVRNARISILDTSNLSDIPGHVLSDKALMCNHIQLTRITLSGKVTKRVPSSIQWF